jgi:hypothetical protein
VASCPKVVSRRVKHHVRDAHLRGLRLGHSGRADDERQVGAIRARGDASDAREGCLHVGQHKGHLVVCGCDSAVGRGGYVTAVVAAGGVVVVAHPIPARRQRRVSEEWPAVALDRSQVRLLKVPAHPGGDTAVAMVGQRVLRTADEVVRWLGGVGDGAARVAERKMNGRRLRFATDVVATLPRQVGGLEWVLDSAEVAQWFALVRLLEQARGSSSRS